MPKQYIKITSNADDFESGIRIAKGQVKPRTIAATQQAMVVISTNVRKYIPAKHRLAPQQRALDTSTGRLWSSFGVPDPKTKNPEYTSTDNIADLINEGRSKFSFEVGSNIFYGQYVNIGFNPLPDRYTPPYHFLELGLEDSEDQIQEYYEYQMIELFEYNDPKQLLRDKKLRTSSVRSINAAQQTRQYGVGFGGQFGPKIKLRGINRINR